jgi:hypothetical protein
LKGDNLARLMIEERVKRVDLIDVLLMEIRIDVETELGLSHTQISIVGEAIIVGILSKYMEVCRAVQGGNPDLALRRVPDPSGIRSRRKEI